MNKRIMNFIVVAILVMPGLISAFEQKQDGITLKVTDYAQKTASVMGYTPDGALTAENFLTKGIHPVRITIKNDTDKPVMISKRSTRLNVIAQEALVDIFQKDVVSSAVFGAAIRLAIYMGITELLGMSRLWYLLDIFLVCEYYQSVVSTKHDVLSKVLKDLSVQEELRYPDVIQPGKKITKLLFIDERIKKNRMCEFLVFDEKDEEIRTKFDIRLV